MTTRGASEHLSLERTLQAILEMRTALKILQQLRALTLTIDTMYYYRYYYGAKRRSQEEGLECV